MAERMGIVPELRARGYRLTARTVTDDGHRIASLDPVTLVGPSVADRYLSIARPDLAAVIYEALSGDAELILDDTVDDLDDDGDRVGVTFESGARRDFDLVIGADGMHSRARQLVFGPEEMFDKYQGIHRSTRLGFQVEVVFRSK